MKAPTKNFFIVAVMVMIIFIKINAEESNTNYAGISGDTQVASGDTQAGDVDITNRVRSEEAVVASTNIVNAATENFTGISGDLDRQSSLAVHAGQTLDITDRVPSKELTIAQENKIKIRITGFIKHDAFTDQRQIFGYGHNQTYIYPLPTVLDARGNDINDTAQWNMADIQSRVNFEIYGPKIFDAKTSGLIAFDFLDNLSGPVSSLNAPGLARMRRAFMVFDWAGHTKLLIGHEFHPLSLDEAYPDTVGYSAGELFDLFTFAPQITLRHRIKNVKLTASVTADYKNPASQNTGFPNDLVLEVMFYIGDNYLLGTGVDYRAEVPRIVTDPLATTTIIINGSVYPPIAPVATNNGLHSVQAYVVSVFKNDTIKWSNRFSYTENGQKYDMFGGTAVTKHDPRTDERSYANIRSLGFWSEFVYRRKKVELAVFFGYMKNIGTAKKIIKTFTNGDGVTFDLIDSFYDKNLAYFIKFQPRIRFYFDPFVLGLELEYGVAGFGTLNDYAIPKNPKTVANPRFALGAVYNF